MVIGLVSCSKKKKKGLHKARELYDSDLFRKSLIYAEKYCDKVYILSVKYGLIDTDRVVADYDMTLRGARKEEKIKWGQKLVEKLEKIISEDDTIVWLAGNDYKDYAMSVLNCNHVEPLKGMFIGNSISHLKKCI